MALKNPKLEPRAEHEPKFDIKNRTDRKILFTILGVLFVCVVILVVLIVLYFCY